MTKNNKEILSDILIKRLDDWGFKHHQRDCHQCSHYGEIDKNGMFVPDDEIVEEHSNNKDFINWLLDVSNKEISDDSDKINKLLKQ
jgi:hypothetical protein